MKILFDHQIFSYQTYGGISRYFFELMNEFQRIDGVRFKLALKYSPNEYLRKLTGMSIKDVPSYLGKSSKSRFLARYILNRRVTNQSLRHGRYDVFHPTFFDPSFLRLLRGRPFVSTLLDMTPEVFPDLFPREGMYNRLVTSRWIKGKRTLSQKAAKVIAISEKTKQDAVHFYGIDANKVVVIHLASSLDPEASEECPALDLSRPFALFVGIRGGYKNFDGFARAIEPLLTADGDLRVVCVGGGAFTDAEKGMLDALGVQDRFVQSSVSDEQLATLYRAARVFVFPSRYEGFGIPIVEAFSCACPCAISRASCFPEIAGDAASYFDPDDQESMTEGMRKVLYDEEWRRGLVAQGLERAKMFSWEKTARQTLSVYEDVIGRNEGH